MPTVSEGDLRQTETNQLGNERSDYNKLSLYEEYTPSRYRRMKSETFWW